jgi:LacI family transcriptional regulator
VSIVLNGKQGAHRIAPETVQRIRQAMEELRYRPHAVAQALAHGRTNTIGVVLGSADMDYLTHPYYGPILQGVVRSAFDRRRFVLLYHGRELGTADLDATSFADGRCDGLILTPPFSAERLAAPLVEMGLPFVTVGDSTDAPRFPSVDIDNEEATRELADYLLRHGHRRILALAMRGYSHSALRRLPACRREVERRGGAYDEEFLPRGDREGIREALRHRLILPEDRDRPTALFCLTDDIALEVLPLVREMGLDVPAGISIVGFDDAPLAADADLTTMRQNPAQIGEEATRLLLRLIDRGGQSGETTTEPTRVFAPTLLVERGSVACVPS